MSHTNPERITKVDIEDKTTGIDVNDGHVEEACLQEVKVLALKGDESDGKINWTARTLLAAISLSGIFTASQILLYFTGGILGFIISDVGNAQAIGWIPTAYLVALSSVCPFVGYLQDLYGRRNLGIFGATLLCIGCILLATTQTFLQAIFAMVVSGAGASISELTALAGISDIVPVKYRGLAIGAITSGMIPFLPFVLYGQLIATRSTWRWTAWLCLIYSCLALAGIVFTYFPKNHGRVVGFNRRAISKELDYIGGLLSTIGLVLVLVALNSGGYTRPWQSADVLCELLIGLALVITFVVWEWKFAKFPMVPAALFQGQRIVALAYIVVFVAGMNFYAFLNLFPTTLSSIYTPSPVETGIRSFGFALGIGLGVNIGDAALSLVNGHVNLVLLFSSALMTAFLGALSVCNPTNSTLTTVLATFAGLGCGGILTPSGTVTMIVVPDTHLATAAALSLSIRAVGGSIGYAIYSNILNNKLVSKVPDYISSYAIGAGLPASEAGGFVTGFLSMPMNVSTTSGVTPAIIHAATIGKQWAFADSFRYVWLSTIAFGCLSMVVCLFIPSLKKYETNRIATEM